MMNFSRKKDRKLLIYGVGKFAEYIRYVFEIDSTYEVIGFCLESQALPAKNTETSLPVQNFDDLEQHFSSNSYELFIAIGNDRIRERIFLEAKMKGYSLASYISSKSLTWENLELKENVFISGDSGIQPFVEIEENCILIAARIAHHCKIGKNSLLSVPVIGAEVEIGVNTFIGMNATIKPHIRIGNYNIIGMGCIISNSTQDGDVFTAPQPKKRNLNYLNVKNQHLR